MIPLTDVEAKYYASMILKDLQAWAAKYRMSPKTQTGFQKRSGTTTNILIISALMDKTLRARASLHLAFIGYKAAFDVVKRDILWGKLEFTEPSAKGNTGPIYTYVGPC